MRAKINTLEGQELSSAQGRPPRYARAAVCGQEERGWAVGGWAVEEVRMGGLDMDRRDGGGRILGKKSAGTKFPRIVSWSLLVFDQFLIIFDRF